MIYIFTGNGKGKTTAAVGMGIRAVGAGKKVLMVQFMKPDGGSSEIGVVNKIKNFEVKSFGRKGFYLPESEIKKNPDLKKWGVKPLGEKDIELAEKGILFAENKIKENNGKKVDLLILDEINLVLNYKLLSRKKVVSFLKKWSKKIDIVLTGRYCPREILADGDLVTEMREIKHYYQQKKGAKKGIEF